ncbi:MAG TPA: DUF4142 domain-containing protein [Luteimonas sp.]
MLGRLIKLGMVAGAGYAAWKALSKQQAKQPFFQQALQSGVADVAAARSAQLRAASAEVRAFAQQMEHEHSEHNLELAQAGGLDLPEPDERQQAELQAIDRLQGEAYDQAWLKHMAKCHRNAIRLYERELGQDGAGGPLAEEVLPRLRSHAERISQLQQAGSAAKQGGEGGGAGSPGGSGGSGSTGGTGGSGSSDMSAGSSGTGSAGSSGSDSSDNPVGGGATGGSGSGGDTGGDDDSYGAPRAVM